TSIDAARRSLGGGVAELAPRHEQAMSALVSEVGVRVVRAHGSAAGVPGDRAACGDDGDEAGVVRGNIPVERVEGAGVSDDDVGDAIDIDAAIGARAVVAFYAVVAAKGVDAGAVPCARAVAVAAISTDGAGSKDADAVANVLVGSAVGDGGGIG